MRKDRLLFNKLILGDARRLLTSNARHAEIEKIKEETCKVTKHKAGEESEEERLRKKVKKPPLEEVLRGLQKK